MEHWYSQPEMWFALVGVGVTAAVALVSVWYANGRTFDEYREDR